MHQKIHWSFLGGFLASRGHRIMGDSNFFKLWKKVCPFIITAKPMTDLCWVCQENNSLIFRSANLTDAQKRDCVAQQEKHLLTVQTERSLYNYMVTEAKKVCAENNIKDLSSNQPCSCNITMHYSFDYAQQVHLPSNSLQPGPIYFLVPRKYGLFGVRCGGLPRQVNFLVDEAHLISKGSNARQQYLYKNIRPFVDDPYKETVCPRPEVLPVDDSDNKSAGGMDFVVNLVLEQT
ncbi:Sulfide:quinone oxidoreductase, mitochondrial [Labeo rohita]|uniref:Sulfide:quinone oxidoreductase, mitochondrial n=1 Tax=Labeo rohita TaxID=84645 RepID=A0ABQ8L4Y2_LABRO|nr:Sulfide:quinone oxidoreductase, mitochondrial [Labeo rohita]